MGTTIMLSLMLTGFVFALFIVDSESVNCHVCKCCDPNRGPQYPQYGARPQYPQFGARPTPQLPQYGNFGPQLPQYGNYGPQLPQYGNYGSQFPQYGNYGGLWGGNKAARPPRWWGQGPGTNIQIGK